MDLSNFQFDNNITFVYNIVINIKLPFFPQINKNMIIITSSVTYCYDQVRSNPGPCFQVMTGYSPMDTITCLISNNTVGRQMIVDQLLGIITSFKFREGFQRLFAFHLIIYFDQYSHLFSCQGSGCCERLHFCWKCWYHVVPKTRGRIITNIMEEHLSYIYLH